MQSANREYLLSSRPAATRGLWPHEHEIPRGTVLYRFIDRRTPPLAAADGPWWFEFEHFQTIRHFAMRQGYSLGHAARLFAAILYEWSEVDGIVRAEVKVPLVAWKGRGKQIVVGQHRPLQKPEIDPRDHNRTMAGWLTEREPVLVSKMTPMQGPREVYQLYIPGVGPPHHGFASYFNFLGFQQIQTG